eukprot:g31773.t1
MADAELEHLQCQEEAFLHHEIFQLGCYEPLQPLEVSEPLIIDVGANVGMFALWALERWKGSRLICIEPLPPIVAEFYYFPWAPGESTRNADEAAEQRVRLWRAAKEAAVTLPMLGSIQIPSKEDLEEFLKSTLCPSAACESEDGTLLTFPRAVLRGIDAEDWPRIRQVVAEVHDVNGRLERIRTLIFRYWKDALPQSKDDLSEAIGKMLASAWRFSNSFPARKKASLHSCQRPCSSSTCALHVGPASSEAAVTLSTQEASLPEGEPLRQATALGISRQFFLHTPCGSLGEQSDRLFETFETRH